MRCELRDVVVLDILCVYVTGKYYFYIKLKLENKFLCPPLKKEGHIALHLSVGMSVALNLVQLITQEGFAPEASNLVGR